MVLLVREKDMVEQRTLTRQESTRNLQSLRMPKFALKLTLLLNFWLGDIAPGLQQETHLSTHAEVRHSEDRQLAQERVTTQFDFVLVLLQELFH